MRKILALLLLLTSTAYADTMYVVCTDSYVNIRDEPSTKAMIGGRLDFGWDVEVSGSTTDSSGTLWYRVDGLTEMGTGWVCANYLIFSQPEKVSKTAKVVSSGRVALYNRVEGKRKTWASKGSTLTVTIYSTEWCYTNKGWIRTKYLEFKEDDPC